MSAVKIEVVVAGTSIKIFGVSHRRTAGCARSLVNVLATAYMRNTKSLVGVFFLSQRVLEGVLGCLAIKIF